MITLKTCFIPSQHTLFYTRRLSNTKKSLFCLCKSNDSDSEASPSEGDTRRQEILARIAMLQAQKVRLTDYLDERSAYLTQFAEEANAEFDKIGEDALRELDEASARILGNIETRMQAFEESSEISKQEIENNESKLAAFEDQIVKDKNEGMFFKNLGDKPSVEKAEANEEMMKDNEVRKEYAGSKARRNIYLGFIVLLVTGIADSFISSSPDWRKVAILGAILVPLLTQFVYEQNILSETQQTEEKNTKNR